MARAALGSCTVQSAHHRADGEVAEAGAIVVPPDFSERFCAHLGGSKAWMNRWSMTEFEPEPGFPNVAFAGTLHAIHLLRRGVGVLEALSADMPGKDVHDLSELLTRALTETGAPRGLDKVVQSNRKVLQSLSRACADIEDWLGCKCAFWMPQLSLSSAACRRSWDDSLYEAWHACKDAAPLPRFTFIELFAGIGGFRIGLEALGGCSVFACELNAHVRATYGRNFAEKFALARPLIDVRCVRSTRIPAFDILTAGFPCQSFTEFNVERAGLDCEGGRLVHEVVRILRETQPAAALLENVPGLLTIHDGRDFKQIVAALRDAGYAVGWQLISAEHYVPQRRLRVYIVCIRRDLHKAQRSTGNEPLGSTFLKDGDCAGEPVVQWLELPMLGATQEKPKPVVRDVLESLGVDTAYTLTEDQWAKVVGFEEGSALALKRLVNLDGQARTLRASYRQDFKTLSQFVPQLNSRPRFFTPRECARLMGFPDSFQPGRGAVGFPRSFTSSSEEGNFYHQLGNSVVPAVIEAIGARIVHALWP